MQRPDFGAGPKVFDHHGAVQDVWGTAGGYVPPNDARRDSRSTNACITAALHSSRIEKYCLSFASCSSYVIRAPYSRFIDTHIASSFGPYLEYCPSLVPCSIRATRAPYSRIDIAHLTLSLHSDRTSMYCPSFASRYLRNLNALYGRIDN